MLVLSRKVNDQIVIAGGIVVTVVEIRGDKVRLGVVAPKDVAVHRHEVAERIGFEGRGGRSDGRIESHSITTIDPVANPNPSPPLDA